jgi:hypothetical protein
MQGNTILAVPLSVKCGASADYYTNWQSVIPNSDERQQVQDATDAEAVQQLLVAIAEGQV